MLPIPTPQIPEGFAIRQVAGEHEVTALVELHRAAFGTQQMTVEDRLSWMRVAEYDPELDLVAVAPGGDLVSYCRCFISWQENAHTGRNEGWCDPIATHPAYQRHGLARALLLNGSLLLKGRGMDIALLGTSSKNIPMQRLAESLGFSLESTKLWFAKEVAQEEV